MQQQQQSFWFFTIRQKVNRLARKWASQSHFCGRINTANNKSPSHRLIGPPITFFNAFTSLTFFYFFKFLFFWLARLFVSLNKNKSEITTALANGPRCLFFLR